MRAAVHLTWRGPLLFGGDSGSWGLSMPRVCLRGEHAAWLIADCAPGGSGERQKGHKQITGQETTGRPSGLLLLSLLFPRPLEDRPECVCAVLELTRAARVTWPGHVQPAPFLPQQPAHKQPGCCGGGGGDVCKRGGGARGPARAKGRTGLLSAASTPAGTGLQSHRKFLVLPRWSKTCFWGSDFQYGLNKKSTHIDMPALPRVVGGLRKREVLMMSPPPI